MDSSAAAWPPADGQCLDEALATAVISSNRHRIRQAIFDAYATIDTTQPGVSAGHRLARPKELVRCCREDGRDGCVVATVLHEGPDPELRRAIEVLLRWDGGVCTVAAESPATRIS